MTASSDGGAFEGNDAFSIPNADAAPEVSDALTTVDVTPATTGLAGFAFVINDVVQVPMTCPSDNWEFPPTVGTFRQGGSVSAPASCPMMPPEMPPCPGVTSARLVNTGQVPVAYIAAAWWSATGYVPGVLTGDPGQLAGVIDPGGQVDISSVYTGGITAVLGSSKPFSSPDAGRYASDEGVIPWPAGVHGNSGGATMWLAEIELRTACGMADKIW
jgi:hypothetical protein